MLPYPIHLGPEVGLEIHGEWQLKAVGNVLVSTLGGSWNEEAALAYFEEYKPLAEPLGRYCILVRYDGWGGYTPEAEAVARILRCWAHDHGCVCAAWVLEDSLMKKWMELFLRRADGLYETRAFSTMPEAIAWLASQGFSLDPAEAAAPDSGWSRS
jgi:hypothetical protein